MVRDGYGDNDLGLGIPADRSSNGAGRQFQTIERGNSPLEINETRFNDNAIAPLFFGKGRGGACSVLKSSGEDFHHDLSQKNPSLASKVDPLPPRLDGRRL